MVQFFFKKFHISLCFFGEVIPALASGDIGVPAGQHGDHRLHPVEVGQGVEAGDFHSIQLVTGDDRDLLHAAEHIQLGEGNLICALTGQTIAAGYAIEGADAAGTAGGRAVFAACLAQLLVPLFAHGVLGGEGTCTHAGGVRFQHADHMVELAVGDTGPQRRVSGQRVGAGREGKDAVIDVAHSTQLGFQHDPFAAVVSLLQKSTDVADVRRKVLGLQLAPAQQGIVGHLFLMVAARQLHVLGVQNHTQTVLGALLVQVEQVAQTQSLFAVLVAVGVGDAAAGGAEGTALLGKAVFFQPILHLVPRHRNGSLIGELQILGADFHTTGFDGLHLVCEVIEVNHHAGAQHTGHVRVQDAGGQQVQDELALLRYNGVAGIVAALIAGNNIGMFG